VAGSAAPIVWAPDWETTLGDCPTALAWDPGCDHLAAASLAGDVVRIDVAAGSTERVVDHGGGALCVAWADQRVLSGGQDGRFAVDGDALAVGGWVAAVAVSDDGRRVGVAHGRQVSILDLAKKPPTVLFEDRHDATVTCLSWDPQSPEVLAVGSFGRIAQMLVPAASGGSAVLEVELPFGGAIAAMHSSSTGWWAAGTRGDFAYLWNDAVTAQPVEVPTGRWSGELLAFCAGGSLLATASKQMTAVFDFEGRDPIGMPSGLWLTSMGIPTALAWRPRSEQLMTAVSIGRGADDNGLLVWEPRRSPTPCAFIATAGPIERLAWASSGDLLAVGFADGTVSVGAVDVGPHC
jgi:WD40 repeat protein